MNAAADILFLAAGVALTCAVALLLARLPVFPLRDVVVVTPLERVTQAQIEYAARSSMTGNFFTVDLGAVRAALEKLPWVRRAQVRRRWPDTLELSIEEHRAAARWRHQEGAEARLVNEQGEVFSAASDDVLPQLGGPEGSAARVMEQYRELASLFARIGRRPHTVMLSAREAWQVRLDDGVLVELGRDQPKSPIRQRVERLVQFYGEALQRLGGEVSSIDLRYPNGFAVRPRAGIQE